MKPILFNTEMVRAILDGRKTVTRRFADINTEITCNDGTANHDFVLDNFTGGTPTGFVCRKCGFGIAPPHSRVPCGSALFRPRYWPGDILYVRETFTMEEGNYYFRADFESDYLDPCETLSGGYPAECRHHPGCEGCSKETTRIRWYPSIHMPKEAARLFLRVTDVRMERLQEITVNGAVSEGVDNVVPCDDSEDLCAYCPLDDSAKGVHCYGGNVIMCEGKRCKDAMEAWTEEFIGEFASLWDSTIKKKELGTCGWDANPWVWVIEYERISKEEAMKEEAK